nr:CU044_2847 family protein [Streptomyces sp. HNM0574]
MDVAYRVREIDLGNGDVVLARVETLDAEDLAVQRRPAGYGQGQDVGALDSVASRAGDVGEVVRRVARNVVDAAREAGPDEVAVTFGLELAAKSGKAVAFVAEGEAKAALSVTLTWRSEERGRTDSRDSAGGAHGSPPTVPAPGGPADA